MRIGQSVWHCKRIKVQNAPSPTYEKPIEIKTRPNYLTVMPTSSRGLLEIIKSGETLYNSWIVTANGLYFENQFKEGDLMWVDGAKPIEEIETLYGYGASANAIVKSVAQVNYSLSIKLEENQNKVEE